MNILFKLILSLFITLSLNANELNHADSYSDAIKDGIAQNKRVVLFTHSPFCPWCRKMEAGTLSNQKVIDLLNKRFIFVTVDLSLDIELEDVPKKFLPQGTPTTYVIDPKTQNLLFSLRGYKNSKSFLNRLSR